MNKEEVIKLSKLARIEISDSEAEKLTGEFGAILNYVGEIKGLSHPTEAAQDRSGYPVRNVLRNDDNAHEGGIFTESILRNAPEREGDYIKVKKILG